ncbi:MAG: type I methionyl aminopeptidase [Clostridiales bacterium]|nr:type I methionyl aminopeptidase [Clostridiales bacterium]
MVTIKNASAVANMKLAGEVTYNALAAVKEAVRPGVSTWELDEIAYETIIKAGAIPSFKGYGGFPGTICASIDGEVVHGIPKKKRILKEGQIISIDCGAIVNGYHGDSAFTVPVGQVDDEVYKLIKRTEESFWYAIKFAKDGARLHDVSAAVQRYVEQFGYGVVRELCGHGIGREMHEDPEVPNYGTPGTGMRLREGMTIAVEPMITLGDRAVYQHDDGWTVSTKDGKPASHYEHTILITKNDPIILTIPEGKEGISA